MTEFSLVTNEQFTEITNEQLWTVFPEVEIKDRKRVVDKDKTPRTLLLLGAGFTERYDPGWGYPEIWHQAKVLLEKTQVGKIFDKFYEVKKSKNFELLLQHSKEFNDFISYINNDIFKIFVEDGVYNGIKKTFVDAMIQCGNKRTLDKIPTLKIGELLTRFDQVHTVSYDPLIYWSIMKYMENDAAKTIGDFFNGGHYDPEASQFSIANVKRDKTLISYLHGALFLSTDEEYNSIKKIANDAGDSRQLMETVKKYFSENTDEQPLIVTDATSKQKLEMILSNKYLSDCYHRLNNFDADKICIIGFRGNENDRHIMDAIIHNRPSEVVLCYYDRLEKEQKDFLKRIKDRNNECKVSTYNVKEDGTLPSDPVISA